MKITLCLCLSLALSLRSNSLTSSNSALLQALNSQAANMIKSNHQVPNTH